MHSNTLERAAALEACIDTRPWANRMRSAADALLSNLRREQLARAQFAFEDEEERRDWDFIPKYRPRGLPLRVMTDREQVLAQQLRHYSQDHLPYVATRVQSSRP
jgi:hypothetical protein